MSKATLLAVICLLIAGAAGYYFGLKVGNRQATLAIAEARRIAIEEVRRADSLIVQVLDSLVIYRTQLDEAEVTIKKSKDKLREVQRQGAGVVVRQLPVDSLVLEFQRIVNTPR